ncbi:MAG: hypothetical protein WC749_13480 [Dehalococcoidia bacterium]
MPDIDSFVDSYKYLKTGANGGPAVYQRLRERQAYHNRLYWVDMASADKHRDLLHLDANHFTSPFLVPRARLMVEYPVNRIAMDKFTVTQLPLLKNGRETKTASAEANEVELWCAAIMDDLALLVRSFVKSMCKDGEGYIRQVLDTDIIIDKEKYKGNPLSWYVPPAKLVYASCDLDRMNRPYEVYEEQVITARKARALAEEISKSKMDLLPNVKPHEYVIWVQGWTQHERMYFAIDQKYTNHAGIPIDGNLITEHDYGFTPYIRAFTGYGEESAEGDPADMAVGILTGWDRVIIGEGRDRTILDTQLAKHALPVMVREWNPGVEPTPKDKELDVSPGAVIDAVGFKANYLMPPSVNPALISQLNDTKELFEAFQPGSITGQIGGRNEPAVGRNIMISQANMQNTPIYISAKTALAQVLGTALETVEKVIQSGVEMRGFKLKPEDIKGNYKVNVEIRTGNPDERLRNLLTMKDLWDFVEHEWLMQELGDMPDATNLLAKKAAQDAWAEFSKTPAGQKLIWERAFTAVEDKEALALMQKAESGMGAPSSTKQDNQFAPEGIGGSPTRGVAPMVEMESPIAGR